MNLKAYVQIENLGALMARNHISVPRLRGLSLMANEKPITKEESRKDWMWQGVWECSQACCSNFRYGANWCEYSSRTERLRKKYILHDKNNNEIAVKWDKVHGKKRKLFKYLIKHAKRAVEQNHRTFNKYVGREDVLYIHARIGGNNWIPYGGREIEKQPWFIERVNDSFDTTYCDIYAKIDPATVVYREESND